MVSVKHPDSTLLNLHFSIFFKLGPDTLRHLSLDLLGLALGLSSNLVELSLGLAGDLRCLAFYFAGADVGLAGYLVGLALGLACELVGLAFCFAGADVGAALDGCGGLFWKGYRSVYVLLI